jgi:hypothetical protein
MAELTREQSALQAAILEAEGEYAELVGEYNAGIYDQQAELAMDLAERDIGQIGHQNTIAKTISKREFNKLQGRVVAAVGSSGLELSGSPLYVLLDNAAQHDYELSVRNWATVTAQENRALKGGLEAWGARVSASKERYMGQLTKALRFREAALTRHFGEEAAAAEEGTEEREVTPPGEETT